MKFHKSGRFCAESARKEISGRHYHDDVEKVLITPESIQAKVAWLGREITADYAGRIPTLVGVLKGGAVFLSDLLKNIRIDCRVDFICLSSYSGAKSTGVVRTLLDLRENIEGRDVIIVEDIVDSGLTLGYLLENMATRRPKSLEICVLLDKPDCRKISVPIKYVGFTVPNQFLVGYGLDYNEIYRNLPYVGVLKKSVQLTGAGKAGR
ncbi:MAG: hypoxanthine phosphoribosyltransferase [bacterium]